VEAVLQRLRAAVPANVRAVCETLARAGHQAVTVGGAVRDAILERVPGDWDVATSAPPDAVIALFPRTVPTGLKHGTVTIVTGRGEESHVEVTTFRGEGAYTDARRPDHVVFGVPLVDDLARRDLRVNAMAYDPAKGELVDPYGGMRDIEQKLLRAVGPTGNVFDDAVARFSEDGLRVMRAVRFAAQLEFALDPETERGIVPALPSLAKVSRERVSDELRKILAAHEPSRALRIAARTGILRTVAPELDAGVQRDVDHWLETIDRATARARLGALIAATAARVPDARRLDRGAVKQATKVMKDLKFSNDEITPAAAIAGAASASRASLTPADVRWVLGEAGRANAAPIVELWRADGSPNAAVAAQILERAEPLVVGDLAISGQDLIDVLALEGAAIGKSLAYLVERVREDPAVNTRDGLLALARAHAAATS
jgi:tRNA nucleotidyltransferase (CCA-adding enzyme)